jgi:hypothetical protein
VCAHLEGQLRQWQLLTDAGWGVVLLQESSQEAAAESVQNSKRRVQGYDVMPRMRTAMQAGFHCCLVPQALMLQYA